MNEAHPPCGALSSTLGSFVSLLQMHRNKENAGQTDPVKTLLGMGSNEAARTLENYLPRHEREMLRQASKKVLKPS